MHFKAAALSILMTASIVMPVAVPPLQVRQSASQQFSGSVTFSLLVPPCYPPEVGAEIVDFAVSYRGHFPSSTDNNGVVTYKGHFEGHGTGVGEISGKKYQFEETDNSDETISFAPPYNEEVQYTETFRIVEQGSGTVYNVFANVYYTYDENNGLAYRRDQFRATC